MATRGFVYVVVFLFSFHNQIYQVCTELVSQYTFYKEIRVSQFTNFGSLQLIDFNVPPLTVSVLSYIRALKAPSTCPVRNISIYWQYSSFPVAEYHGKATFPENFILSRSYLNSTVLPSVNVPILLRLDNPLAGTWFIAAFVEKEDDQVIKKITNVDCSYGIQMNLTTYLMTSVVEITPEKDFDLLLESQDNLFRFFVGSNVFKYSVNLTCPNESPCPLKLSSRASGFPSNDSDTITANCTTFDSPTCLLHFLSPAVDQWHYLHISCLHGCNEEVKLSIKFSVCDQTTQREPTKRTTTVTHNTVRTRTVTRSYTAAEDSEVVNATISHPQVTTSAEININSTAWNETDENNENLIFAVVRNRSLIAVNDDSAKFQISVDDTQKHEMSSVNQEKQIQTRDGDCFPPARFSEVADVDNVLSTVFSLQPMSSETLVVMMKEIPYLMRFDLNANRDIGATLKIEVELHEVIELRRQHNDTLMNVSLEICIQKDSIPLNDMRQLSCSSRGQYFLVTPSNHTLLRWYPYPEPGPWFVGFQKVCFSNTSERVPCQRVGAATLKVMTTPCIDNRCSNTGNCVEYGASIYTYAACQCNAGYLGFGCDDSSKAADDDIQKMYSFILSMSNLFFIPAIIVACVRKRFPEAIVYFANMFFSSFYHACDMSTWSKYKLCIMPYHVLSFCDFYCSMLSFWVTLIAMARLPVVLRSAAHMTGAVALAMAMKWSMHGVIANAVPIATGVGIVVISWAVRCGRLRRLYPQKQSLLWAIPGVVLAGFGICLFAFIETDANYPYTHSVWHVCMATSVVFLLPRSKVQVKDESTSDSSSFLLENFDDTTGLVTGDFAQLT